MLKINKKHSNSQKMRVTRFAYPDTHSFIQAMYRWDTNNYHDFNNDSFYFRSGSYSLAVCEKKIGELVDAEKLILTTSGMSAVITALEVASLKTNDIVVHGQTEYGQIYNYITLDLAERGILSKEVNTGSLKDIEKTLKELVKNNLQDKIKVIFFETVGNGPFMPLLDIENFLALPILNKINPLIILDNTLSTNSIIHLSKLTKESRLRIIGLESATKFYLLNQDLGGILFTHDEKFFQLLLNKRKRIGATPGYSLIKTFQKLTPKTKKTFNSDNMKTIKNTFLLAASCDQIKGDKIAIDYPNLLSHENYNLAQKKYPHGCAPVFFIRSKYQSLTSEKLFVLLEEKGAFKDVILSDSFGFSKTSACFATRNGGYIRVAGGLEPFQQVKKISINLKQTLQQI